jgi:hypothetical protein
MTKDGEQMNNPTATKNFAAINETFAALRACPAANGGSLLRTDPQDGPVRYFPNYKRCRREVPSLDMVLRVMILLKVLA